MGPQSLDCGRYLGLLWLRVLKIGFNGAAVTRLRKAILDPTRDFVTIRASMGPQSLDCGRGDRRLLTLSISEASMGPQSLDCGRSPTIDSKGRKKYSFNGAAVTRLRKAVQCFAMLASFTSRFNGAAVTRLRKARFPAGALAGWTCFNGAAVTRLRKAFQPRTRARNFASFNGAAVTRLRKGDGNQEIRTDRCGLQWGRSHSTAEGNAKKLDTVRLEMLQWGRSHSTAEGFWAMALAASSISASMGPQSLDCGRQGNLPLPQPRKKLQWGRSHSTAEGYLV